MKALKDATYEGLGFGRFLTRSIQSDPNFTTSEEFKNKTDFRRSDFFLVSKTYDPVRSAESNLDSVITFSEAMYARNGDVVTVAGRFTADPTATGATSFEMTIPIVSDFLAIADLAGVAFCGGIAGQGAEIIGVIANNTAKVQWIAADTTSKVWSYQFSYRVL